MNSNIFITLWNYFSSDIFLDFLNPVSCITLLKKRAFRSPGKTYKYNFCSVNFSFPTIFINNLENYQTIECEKFFNGHKKKKLLI